MAFEDFLRALGMVDEEGNVFDGQEIQRQVLSALGVGEPVLETVAVKRPPFGNYSDCCEACLTLPAPGDGDFDAASLPARTLAVAVILEMEMGSGGVQQFLYNCGSPYALQAADALRELGLPEHAAAYEAYLAQYHLDRDTLDILCPENAPVDEDPWSDDLDLLYERIPSETLEAAADWDALQGAILAYANRHPEVFREPEEEKEGPQS